MKLFSTLFIAFLFFLLTPLGVFAQQFQSDSNIIRTTIGKPPIDNGLIAAGQDLKQAFDVCENGYTNFTLTLQGCLVESLTSSGRPQEKINALANEYPSTIADGCTQCLGFVRLIAALAHGNGSGLALNSAADVAAITSFTTGDATYQRISGSPQPGDIGAKGGGFGHIVIVKEVLGNVKITALESNANYDCKVTDTRQILTDGYVFFRAQ